jgi:uncharacterized protein VirK/YbjX
MSVHCQNQISAETEIMSACHHRPKLPFHLLDVFVCRNMSIDRQSIHLTLSTKMFQRALGNVLTTF